MTLGEKLVYRGDGECAIQPTIEGGQIRARDDLMLLLVGHRQTTLLQDHHQRLGLALGDALVVESAVLVAEELHDLGVHVQGLSRGFARPSVRSSPPLSIR